MSLASRVRRADPAAKAMTPAGREMDHRRGARAALMMAAAGHGTVRAALCQLPPAEEHGTMSIQSRTSISRGPQRISESVSQPSRGARETWLDLDVETAAGINNAEVLGSHIDVN